VHVTCIFIIILTLLDTASTQKQRRSRKRRISQVSPLFKENRDVVGVGTAFWWASQGVSW
jgi:hypothetical protein